MAAAGPSCNDLNSIFGLDVGELVDELNLDAQEGIEA